MYFGENRRWVSLCNVRLAASLLKLMVVAEPMSVCGPLSLKTFCGILNLANIFFKLLMTQVAVGQKT